MKRSQEHLDPDLRELASALEEERPRLTESEFDRVKRRAMAGGARTTSAHTFRPKRSIMRSRLAITTTLATGLLMSGGGAALGVSALSSTDSASVAQYGTTSTPPPTTTVTTTVTTTTPAPAPTLSGVAGVQQESPDQGVAGVQDEGPGGPRPTGSVAGVQVAEAPEAAAQAPRQLAADGELPFTGYASITMLVVGLLLLAGGLVLRRSTRRTELQL